MTNFSTVAVTGASGLMGRTVVPALHHTGATVRVLSRHATTHSTTDTIKGDLADGSGIGALVTGADAIVHLAGVAHTILRTQSDRDHAHAVNVRGTVQLLQAARAAGVRQAIVMSSAHVYAGQQGLNLTEQSATARDTAYGALKLEMEEQVRSMHSPAFRVTILRPCLTYGPAVRHNLHALLRAIRGGYYIHPGGADAARSFLSVQTVASAVLHFLQSESAGDTYNLADREPVSLRAWVNHLADMMDVRKPRTVPVSILRVVATAGTAASKVGLPAPLTRDSLRKLVAPFSLNTDALASTGFIWPASHEHVLRSMIEHDRSVNP